MDPKLENQIREMIRRQFAEMEIPHSYQSFDTGEFKTDAKKTAKTDIEDSGQEFVDLGDHKYETGMDSDDFVSDLERANLQLPSDEEILKTVQKNLDKKSAAKASMGNFSLNEKEIDPIATAKTSSLDTVDWEAQGREYADNWDTLSDEEKNETISFLKNGWHMQEGKGKNYMSPQNLKNIKQGAEFLLDKIDVDSEIEDWAEDKISKVAENMRALVSFYKGKED